MKSGKIDGTETVAFAGLEAEIIAGSNDSPVTVVQMMISPGRGAPLHISYDEDKIFLITEGSLRFTVGDALFDVAPGDRVAVGRGEVHGFVNMGQSQATQLLISSPARHDQFFRAMAELSVPVEPALLDAVCNRFNQKIVGGLYT
jgi:mannose-6-phosphate isomerase-like protein (cupin superfamily)